MSAHRIASITIDPWGVNSVVDCLAEPGEECRFHSGCQVVDWWDWAGEYAEAYVGKPHPFVPGPIEVSVDDGRYVWRYADDGGVP